MVGLSILCLGSLEEKLRLLFELYDVNGSGTLEAEEIFAMSTALYKLIGLETSRAGETGGLRLNSSPLGKYQTTGVSKGSPASTRGRLSSPAVIVSRSLPPDTGSGSILEGA